MQALHTGTVVVAAQPRNPGVDHIADAGNRQRGLRHIGGEDHPSPRPGMEDPALLFGGQARQQRQHLDAFLWKPSAKNTRALANIAFTG